MIRICPGVLAPFMRSWLVVRTSRLLLR
jgi:hypothetical protein